MDYPALIKRVCESALASKSESELDRWAKTLAMSGLG